MNENQATPVSQSDAEEARAALEEAGCVCIKANVEWFAVNPVTVERRARVAATRGVGLTYIIYRTGGDPRDHYVVPASELARLLPAEAIRPVRSGGRRWNCTLDGHVIRVRHVDGTLDVRQYHRIPLPTERIADAGTIERQFIESVRALSGISDEALATAVAAESRRPSRFRVVSTEFRRSPHVVALVLRRAAGVCEQCRGPAPFARVSDGTPFLEVHHDVPLANGGGRHRRQRPRALPELPPRRPPRAGVGAVTFSHGRPRPAARLDPRERRAAARHAPAVDRGSGG